MMTELDAEVKKENNIVDKCKGQPSNKRLLHEKVNDILGNVLSNGILNQDMGPMEIRLNEIKDAIK